LRQIVTSVTVNPFDGWEFGMGIDSAAAPQQMAEMANFMGLDGFEFVEFTSPDPEALAGLFVALGFTHVGTHRSKNVRRYAQGGINFLLNMDTEGQVAEFRNQHGPSANAMAFHVHDAAAAFAEAVKRGATPVHGRVGPMELNIPAIEGIGGSNLYLVDNAGEREIYDVDFRPVPGATPMDNSVGLPHARSPDPQRQSRPHGDHWADFYETIFNFREIRYFDIEGQSTGPVFQGDDRAR
jgi:4-hydroxyphenylpyruvate dioxygenase